MLALVGALLVAFSTPLQKPAAPARFPTPDTAPADVVVAQLQALSSTDLIGTYELFSRARRSIIVESGCAQGGGTALALAPPPDVLRKRVRQTLDEFQCPGLIGHASHEVISGLTLNERTNGRIPQYRCRVKVETFYADMYDMSDGGFLAAAAAAQPPSYFIFTLTRQHDDPPATDKEVASFEGCWFVWTIEPERRGGGGGDEPPPDDDDDDGPPGRELLLPQPTRLIAA